MYCIFVQCKQQGKRYILQVYKKSLNVYRFLNLLMLPLPNVEKYILQTKYNHTKRMKGKFKDILKRNASVIFLLGIIYCDLGATNSTECRNSGKMFAIRSSMIITSQNQNVQNKNKTKQNKNAINFWFISFL